jgi:hypothetical protein
MYTLLYSEHFTHPFTDLSASSELFFMYHQLPPDLSQHPHLSLRHHHFTLSSNLSTCYIPTNTLFHFHFSGAKLLKKPHIYIFLCKTNKVFNLFKSLQILYFAVKKFLSLFSGKTQHCQDESEQSRRDVRKTCILQENAVNKTSYQTIIKITVFLSTPVLQQLP